MRTEAGYRRWRPRIGRARDLLASNRNGSRAAWVVERLQINIDGARSHRLVATCARQRQPGNAVSTASEILSKTSLVFTQVLRKRFRYVGYRVTESTHSGNAPCENTSWSGGTTGNATLLDERRTS